MIMLIKPRPGAVAPNIHQKVMFESADSEKVPNSTKSSETENEKNAQFTRKQKLKRESSAAGKGDDSQKKRRF
jgi:hypothetical protein